jgi:uncharacterized membrane protein YkvA (DUF1232 family)
MGVGTVLSRPGLLMSLVSRVRLATRLLREPRVPLAIKAVPLAALVYLIVPLDLVPDFLLVLGELDDLGFILVAIEIFVRLCPAAPAAFHKAAIAEGAKYAPMPSTFAHEGASAADHTGGTAERPVIDAEWRRD